MGALPPPPPHESFAFATIPAKTQKLGTSHDSDGLPSPVLASCARTGGLSVYPCHLPRATYIEDLWRRPVLDLHI